MKMSADHWHSSVTDDEYRLCGSICILGLGVRHLSIMAITYFSSDHAPACHDNFAIFLGGYF